MKVLLISPYFSPAVGGVETHLNDLCNYFRSKKYTVFVRTYKAFGTKERGATSENDKFIKIHRLWWPDFNLVFKLEKYTILRILYIGLGLFIDCLLYLFKNSKKIDVIQAHGLIAALWVVPLARLFKKRVVVNTHVGFKFRGGIMDVAIKLILSNSDKVLVLTQNAKDALIKIGINSEKIIIYHYWVDQEQFSPWVKVARAKSKINLGWFTRFVVLFVGRLVLVKGVETVISLARKMKEVHFVVAGSGPLADRLKSYASRTTNLTFLGKVEQKDLPRYYNSADVVLIPSKIVMQTYEEGIPRVMIESLSCGTPIIATPSGGVPNVFEPSIGILVKDNLSEMMKAIKNLQKDKKVISELSKNCRSFAEKRFDQNKNAKIIEQSLLQK